MMATLEQNVKQAIADFDSIKSAIEAKGVEVPSGTDTREYGALIGKIGADEYERGYAAGYAEGLAVRTYETWTITYADGTVEEKEVALL